jgi:hypothetical protein
VNSHLHICLRTGSHEKQESTTHKDTGTTFRLGALAAKSLDLAVRFNFVIFKNGHLDFLPLVLDFLGGLVTGRSGMDRG